MFFCNVLVFFCQEFVFWVDDVFLLVCVVVNVVVDGLFGKYSWVGFEIVGLLVGVELVFICVVFDQVVGWVFEVLEVC